MSLVVLVREDNWQEFDRSWQAQIDAGAPIDDLVSALAVVAEKRRMPRCLPLVREHAEKLGAAGRHADAAQLLGTALVGGGPPGELGEPLFRASEAAWGSEPFWIAYREKCGFDTGMADPRRAWKDLREMMAYRPGAVVFHAAGWGVGEVTAIDAEALQVHVAFESGRKDRFPLKTAVEIFELLAEDDLRVQGLRDKDALRKRLKDEPLEILRAVLNRYNGRAQAPMIKNVLAQVGITGSAWTSWWKKARLLAENDPWFRVNGRSTKLEITMLARAIDPSEGIRRELRHAATLSQALARVRELLTGEGASEEVKHAALSTLEELAAEADSPRVERFATWLYLRDQYGTTPGPLAALLVELAALPASKPTDAPPLWAAFAALSTVREHERCVELLQEVLGEEWLHSAEENLLHAPSGMVKPLVDALLQANRKRALAEMYNSLLARPMRAPFLLMALTRLGEDGVIQGDFPTPSQRAQALLELAVFLFEQKKGNTVLTRAHQRLVDLLTKGEPPLLEQLLSEAQAPTMRVLANMLHRGVDETVDTIVTDLILRVAPEVIRGGDKPFWAEEDRIWTTEAGLRRRERELRELHDERIPANRDAIARAASYGDLSENAEWEQAIEEQRQLSEAASQMERELRQAALLDQVVLPEDTVCPGTTVHYVELETGKQRRIVVLGPWDSEVEDAVSYRAPLAQGMLGLHPGDESTIQLPQGTIRIRVLETELADALVGHS